ncbi:hypothetical protein [Nostoc sp.]|uniref:hypothetical protein n=1 Tax=Nostoc sp. TaxID=1180 RepID=UPI002FF70E34
MYIITTRNLGISAILSSLRCLRRATPTHQKSALVQILRLKNPIWNPKLNLTFADKAPELPVLWVVTPGGLTLGEFPFGEAVRLLSV